MFGSSISMPCLARVGAVFGAVFGLVFGLVFGAVFGAERAAVFVVVLECLSVRQNAHKRPGSPIATE